MEKTLVNRVEQSGLITLDLASFSSKASIELFDLKDFLVKGLMLMEKPFREQLKDHDWENYESKIVGIHCSNDALIPMWAYMLVSSYLEPVAKQIIFGDQAHVESTLIQDAIKKIDPENYRDARVVIKGCGDGSIHPEAFVEITKKLKPVVASLMYGEPCSTVPVYKKQVKRK